MFSKDGVLLFVQADHLNGESLGSALEALYRAGASNVNVLPTTTKKNRPGHLVLIDCLPVRLEAVEDAVCRELEVSGWHRLDTTQCYRRVEYPKKAVRAVLGQETLEFLAEGKVVDGELASLRPEHRSCLEIKNALEARGVAVPLSVIRQRLYECFQSPEPQPIIFQKE